MLTEADESDENDTKYSDRLNDYTAKLDALKTEYGAANLTAVPLATSHDAYRALCYETAMNYLPIDLFPGGDPSPAQLAEVVNSIKDKGAKYVFYDPIDGDKIAKSAAREAGIETAELYAFEGDSENRDYETVMRFNLEQLKKAR